MFEGDQFHQFIGSSSTTVLSPLSNFSFHGFDSYLSSSSSSSSLHMTTSQLHHQESSIKNINNNIDDHDGKHESSSAVDDEVRERRSSLDPIWSNDEVLALLKIKSSLEIWYPDFTWEHVSRKLSELGFKRSPDQCRQKLEEESCRQFNNNNNDISYNTNKHYRPIFSDLEEIYPTQHHHQQQQQQQDAPREDMEKDKKMCTDNNVELEENPSQEISEDHDQVAAVMKKHDNKKKRKRKSSSPDSNDKKKYKFEKFKGFCEAVVAEMVARQEELHRRLIEGIVKSDEESVAREEEWKNQERERMRREMEMREKEQADVEERQATIVEILKKFMIPSDHDINHHHDPELPVKKKKKKTTTPMISESNNPSSTNDGSSITQIISTNTPVQKTASRSPSPSSEKDSKPNVDSSTDYETRASSSSGGKRWPREEVLALINLRCKLMSNCSSISDDSGTKEGGGGGGWRGPLWERISRGMSEMGYYDRNAKRCKEKWENINKYFRKTRDGEGKRKTKRSVDSRTCPYFQQLSRLYPENQ